MVNCYIYSKLSSNLSSKNLTHMKMTKLVVRKRCENGPSKSRKNTTRIENITAYAIH